METEDVVSMGVSWVAFVLSFLSLFWFTYQMKLKQCGWEVVYVATLEAITYVLIVSWGENEPFLWKLHGEDTPDEVPFIRYAAWLVTCPVTLIALANLTGLKDDYNWRTMQLLSADQGTILCGATAAMCTGHLRVIFFLAGVAYGVVTYYSCLQVYIESYANVPPPCKRTVATMAYMFMFSWGSFPLMFLLGPEGFNHISPSISNILHGVADLFAKNLWGVYAWYLRIQVRNYHRQKWFEEQERLKKGEGEYEVDQERRPQVESATVTTLFTANQAAGEEDEVDPYYAEYRRRRRRNRGRSLSEPEPPASMMGKGMDEPDMVLEPPKPMSLYNQPAVMGMNPYMNNGLNGMMAGMNQMNHQMGQGGGQGMLASTPMASPMASTPVAHSPMGNNMGMATPGPLTLVLADHMGLQQGGQFFMQQLQSEFGAQVFPVDSKAGLEQQLAMAQQTGTPVAAVFVMDGLMQQAEAFQLMNNYKTPLVQYGSNPSPQSIFGDAYLQAPQPGVPYNNSQLMMLVNRLRTQQLGGTNMPSSPMSMAMMQQAQQQLGGAPQTPQQGAGAQDAGASVDQLMAEMNALKSYLSATPSQV